MSVTISISYTHIAFRKKSLSNIKQRSNATMLKKTKLKNKAQFLKHSFKSITNVENLRILQEYKTQSQNVENHFQ